MKQATTRGPQRLIDHTDRCQGDGHGMFTMTSELPPGPGPAPGLWFLNTCTHCGTQTWRNTKGERMPCQSN